MRAHDMVTKRRGAAAVMTAAAFALLLGTQARAAEENCQWYALTSAKQQQQNEQKGCGFKGEGWTTDTNVHMAWCTSVSPDEWRPAVEQRKKQLEACG